MGKRSGILDHEADILQLTLAELDAEIGRCEARGKIAPTAYLRKSFNSRVLWLGKVRSRHPELNSN